MVQSAPEAADQLPDPGACALPDRRLLPPEGQRQEVDRLEQEAIDVSALAAAGLTQEALQRATELERRAQALGHSPLEAEAALLKGRLTALLTTDYRAAEQLLHRAVVSAEVGRDDRAAAEAWIELISVRGERLGQPEEGLRAADHAQALAEVLGPPGRLQVRVLSQRGLLLWGSGRLAEALGQLHQALGLAEHVYPPDSPSLAAALTNLGLVLKEEGSLEEAGSFHRQALAILEKALGRENPRLSSALNRLGLVLYEMGRYREATSLHLRGLALREASLPPSDPAIGAALLCVIQDLSTVGDHAGAMKLYDRALAIHLQAFGEHNLRTAGAYQVLGEGLVRQGQPERGAALLAKGLANVERTLGKHSPLRAQYLSSLGDAERDLRHHARARELYAEAVQIRQAESGEYSPFLVEELTREAEMLLRLSKRAQALPLLERALRLSSSSALAPELQAETRAVLASALLEGGGGRGSSSRACRLLGEARALLRKVEGEPPEKRTVEKILELHVRGCGKSL